MLQNIFTDQSTAHLIEIFLWLLGAFLIGYFFARFYYKNKSKDNREISFSDLEEISSDTTTIKAKKTFERGGEQVISPKKEIPLGENKPILNFENFGIASEAEKDDLKKINGIGAFIEIKLNKIGIYTYNQISKFSKEDIVTITELIKFFPGRIERDSWVEQAKNLTK